MFINFSLCIDTHDVLREFETILYSKCLFLHPHKCFQSVCLFILLLLVCSVALTDYLDKLFKYFLLSSEFEFSLLSHIFKQKKTFLKLYINNFTYVICCKFVRLITTEALLLLSFWECCSLRLGHSRALKWLLLLICWCLES